MVLAFPSAEESRRGASGEPLLGCAGQPSHEVITKSLRKYIVRVHIDSTEDGLLSKVVVIGGRVRDGCVATNTSQRRLGLRRLALLSALLSGLLLLQLLVAQCGQSTRNLLDLIAGEILRQLLGKLLKEDGVVRLLGAVGQDRNKGVAQLLELGLGRWVEQRDCAKVNGAVWIICLEQDGAAWAGGLARADSDTPKEIFGVAKIRLLFSPA